MTTLAATGIVHSMTDPQKARADARLDAALDGGGVRDPRPLYRPILRLLRERDPESFDRSVRYLEEELVPAVAADADPLAVWLGYGRRLAEAVGPGRAVDIGPSGRAHTLEEGATPRGLLLYLPDDDTLRAFVLRYPAPATRAQDATFELLVEGRVTGSAYDGR